MSQQEPTLAILASALERVNSINTPNYITKFYAESPAGQELDKMKSINWILNRAKSLEKPAICILGPYSSGKTFILNYLIQDEMLVSKIDPTTAVITVIRHIDDKPNTWPATFNVFTLKKNADLRTLDYKFVKNEYTLEDLPRLTTYPEAIKHEAVIVFLEKDILKNCTFYDCPGVGTMHEATHLEDGKGERLSSTQEKTIREQELQRRAIDNADAFIILSAVLGGSGSFSDSNTGNILYAVANNMPRFPTTIPHGNLLFVGSQADPRKKGLHDEEDILRVLRNAIQNQVEHLPRDERHKFDIVELRKRIVLFYALDQYEIDNGIGDIVLQLKRNMEAATSLDIRREADAQFAAKRAKMERTEGFNAALQTAIEQLLLGMREFRARETEDSLSDGIKHYSEKRLGYLSRGQNQMLYENLSRRYEKDRDLREKDWESVISSFEANVLEAKQKTMEEIETILISWSVKENVYDFLAKKFGDDKEKARAYATKEIQKKINAEFVNALNNNVSMPQQRLEKQLLAFDKNWLQRNTSKKEGIAADATLTLDAVPVLVTNVETVSVSQTFGAITAGLAGTTTLFAASGSILAAAALGKVLAIGIAGLKTVGLGAAATGLLAGIPIGGWIALGILGIVYSVTSFLGWRKSLATNIAKSFRNNKEASIQSAQVTIEEIFEAMSKIGKENLEKTKAILDEHIVETHNIGKGSVTSKDMELAGEFYGEHVKVLQQTLEKLKLEWEASAH